MASVAEFNKKVEISIGAIIFIIVATFTVTSIYNQMVALQQQITLSQQKYNKQFEEQNQWLLELDQRLLNVERCD